MVPPLLKTARLRLRVPSLDDARAIFAGYATDPAVTRYLSWRTQRSLAGTNEFLPRTIAAIEAGSQAQWVIERQGFEQAIGMIGFRLTIHAAELGYVLARPCWGHRYATEAAKALVDWALAEPMIYRVSAVCDIENSGSAREGRDGT